MNDVHDNFDDPDLKSALKRLRGSHTTPADLRRRVTESLYTDATTKPGAARHKTPSIIWWVAAACLVLGMVRGAVYWRDASERAMRQSPEAKFADNTELLGEMVWFHETDTDTQGVVSVALDATLKSLQDRAEKDFGHPVPLPDLGKDWTLVSAGVTLFEKQTVSRFNFKRGSSRLTLISFPANYVQAVGDGKTYDLVESNHPIAGYSDHDSVHCLIGDAGMPLAEVSVLRDRLRAQ